MIKVDGYSHLYRDEKTGAIINRNNTEYQNRLRKIKSTETQKEDLNKMREDINELKGLLRQLLEKRSD